jgi:hypothetical protein
VKRFLRGFALAFTALTGLFLGGCHANSPAPAAAPPPANLLTNPRTFEIEVILTARVTGVLSGEERIEENVRIGAPPDEPPHLMIWSSDLRDHSGQQDVRLAEVEPPPTEIAMDAENGNRLLFWDFSDQLKPDTPATSSGRLPHSCLRRGPHRRLPSSSAPPDAEALFFTKSEPFNEITDEIRAAAREAAAGAEDPAEKARRIFDWTRASMTYAYPPPGGRGALVALREKSGDCGQYADLFISLCRAEGIPARFAGGWSIASTPARGRAHVVQVGDFRADGRGAATFGEVKLFVILTPSPCDLSTAQYLFPRALQAEFTELTRAHRFMQRTVWRRPIRDFDTRRARKSAAALKRGNFPFPKFPFWHETLPSCRDRAVFKRRRWGPRSSFGQLFAASERYRWRRSTAISPRSKNRGALALAPGKRGVARRATGIEKPRGNISRSASDDFGPGSSHAERVSGYPTRVRLWRRGCLRYAGRRRLGISNPGFGSSGELSKKFIVLTPVPRSCFRVGDSSLLPHRRICFFDRPAECFLMRACASPPSRDLHSAAPYWRAFLVTLTKARHRLRLQHLKGELRDPVEGGLVSERVWRAWDALLRRRIASFHLRLARLAGKEGRLGEAWAEARAALRLRPHEPELWAMIWRCAGIRSPRSGVSLAVLERRAGFAAPSPVGARARWRRASRPRGAFGPRYFLYGRRYLAPWAK